MRSYRASAEMMTGCTHTAFLTIRIARVIVIGWLVWTTALIAQPSKGMALQKLSGDSPSQGIGWQKLADKVDKLVKDMMNDHHIVGMTAAVSKDGRLLLSKGYGYARYHDAGGTFIAAPMTADTRSRIGSVSKAVITAPVGEQLLREKGIDPKSKKLYGDGGVFGHQYDFEQQVGTKRFAPIVAMAIGSDDKVYTWYVNGKFTVGASSDLDRYQQPKSFSIPEGYRPIDIQAIAISKKNKVYVWYNDGKRSVGTPDNLAKHKKPKDDQTVKLPGGQSMWNVVGVAIAKSNNHVYAWYDDGTVSSGTTLDFTRYFPGKSYSTPSEEPGSMSPYDIRGMGISKDDLVYTWYSNDRVSVGSSIDLDKYKAPYPYSIPAEELEYLTNRLNWWGKITVQHLRDHEAGFQQNGDQPGARRMFGVSQEALTYDQVHRHFLRTRPLKWSPGWKYFYSNHGFGLWTLIVPALSGQSYLDYAVEHYLKPLGLWGKVRPRTATPDLLDAYPYNYDPRNKKLSELGHTEAGLGLAAGGWTASAKELLWITRHLSRTYTVDELIAMGWGSEGDRSKNHERLGHDGVINGGIAYVTIFPEGYISIRGKKDLSNIHVALACNTRPLNKGNKKAQDKAIKALKSLASKIALAVPDSKIPDDYNLWGGFSEWARHGVPKRIYPYVFEHGYRPVWIDAYDVHGNTFFNVIFRPEDGVPWVARHGLSASQYQAEFEKWTGKGFRLHQVESYVDGNQVRYAAIFVKQSGPAWTAYHGKTPAEHQQMFNSLTAQGYRPVNVAVTSLKGDIRVAALYEKRDVGSFVSLTSIPVNQYQKKFDENRKAGRQLVYLNAWEHNGKILFSAIWNSATKGKYVARHGLTGEKYQSEWEKRTRKGYLTGLVTGYGTNKGARFAALWRKNNQPVVTPMNKAKR